MKANIIILILMMINMLYGIQFIGKVINVHDGDTITIEQLDKTSNGRFTIRLKHIDCPEYTKTKKINWIQSGGKEAMQFLNFLIFNKEVKIKFNNIDIFGRIVGEIYLGNKNINYYMLESGYAWYYPYNRKNYKKQLQILMIRARQKKIGIWKYNNLQQPWKFRQRQRKNK